MIGIINSTALLLVLSFSLSLIFLSLSLSLSLSAHQILNSKSITIVIHGDALIFAIILVSLAMPRVFCSVCWLCAF